MEYPPTPGTAESPEAPQVAVWPPSPRKAGFYSPDHKMFWNGQQWVPLPKNAQTGVPAYAWFGLRFWGFLIDTLLVSSPFLLIDIVVISQLPSSASRSSAFSPPIIWPVVALTALQSLALATYMVWFWTRKGQTLGQKAVGIEVVRAEDGGLLTTSRAVTRSVPFWLPGLVGQFVPGVSLLTTLALVWALWDPRSQGLHDKMANSLVVMHRRPRGMSPGTVVFLGILVMLVFGGLSFTVLMTIANRTVH